MDLGKTHIVVMWTVGPDEVAAGDAVFQSHGKWMEGHSREGDTALLDYSISKGPELANPVDPDSAPTGDTVFVLDEFYASPAGVVEHWRLARDTWQRSAGLHGLDQQGQEGRHAAQRDGDPGPLVAAWGRHPRSASPPRYGTDPVPCWAGQGTAAWPACIASPPEAGHTPRRTPALSGCRSCDPQTSRLRLDRVTNGPGDLDLPSSGRSWNPSPHRPRPTGARPGHKGIERGPTTPLVRRLRWFLVR